jgi:hypothetical protein
MDASLRKIEMAGSRSWRQMLSVLGKAQPTFQVLISLLIAKRILRDLQIDFGPEDE